MLDELICSFIDLQKNLIMFNILVLAKELEMQQNNFMEKEGN